jgi:DNA-binding GntR family transcriptional regulator
MTAQDSVLGCDLNQQFHFALVDIAGLPFLQGILYRIWLQMGPLIAAVYQQGGSDMIDYHYPVLAAIRQRRPGGRRAIGDDILHGGHSILLHLQARAPQ